ncbi:MAG TPA: glycosyltransferase family 4 protein, partial [Candidatus Baltobacteraceae bacterium]|nr:glycosyltransferase family 4 protein [Candidatus Baltobacteraceae bacterium]
MKIDIVSALYGLEPGGAEISTRILVAELLALGVDVEVVSSRREALKEPGGAVLPDMTWVPWQIVLYAPNRILDWMFRAAFIRRWRERKPDVVLIEDHLSIVGAVEAVESLRKRGQPIALAVTQMWEVDSEFFFDYRAFPIAALFVHRFRVANGLAKRMDLVNALTQYLRRRVVDRLNVQPERVGVFPTIAIKEGPKLESPPPERPLLLAPGRINPEKGSLFFLDVVRSLAARRRDFQAVFLGGGPHEEIVRTAIEREGLSDVCSITGKIPYTEFVKYYGEATAVVAPIMYPCGYTRVVLESLYAGKPVITFDQGSMPEIVIDGVTGYRVQPGSVEAFADACERFIDDPGSARAMSDECRRVAIEHADVRRAARELLDALNAAHQMRTT